MKKIFSLTEKTKLILSFAFIDSFNNCLSHLICFKKVRTSLIFIKLEEKLLKSKQRAFENTEKIVTKRINELLKQADEDKEIGGKWSAIGI